MPKQSHIQGLEERTQNPMNELLKKNSLFTMKSNISIRGNLTAEVLRYKPKPDCTSTPVHTEKSKAYTLQTIILHQKMLWTLISKHVTESIFSIEA